MARRSWDGGKGPALFSAQHSRSRYRTSVGNICCSHYRERGTRFEVSVNAPFLRAGVFDAQNMITVPHAKYLRTLGRLDIAKLQAVENAVRSWLGL